MTECRVAVGPGKLSTAVKGIVAQPALWASIIGMYLFFTQTPSNFGALELLPFPVNAATSALAEAHFTLSLLAFGVILDARMPHFRQVGQWGNKRFSQCRAPWTDQCSRPRKLPFASNPLLTTAKLRGHWNAFQAVFDPHFCVTISA